MCTFSTWTKSFLWPPKPPYGEYITAIGTACQHEAGELSNDIYRVLRQPHHPKPKLSKDEWEALKQLKEDKNNILLTADKGVPLVVIDRQDYIKKARDLLKDTNTYSLIPTDPTNRYKAKLINILKSIIRNE